MDADAVDVEVDGRVVRLTNLHKALYPSGFTKADVVNYYVTVAAAMLPHVEGRAITFRRFPDGTAADGFYNKRCPGHRPEWVSVATGPGDGGDNIEYCVIDSTAALVWAANLAALELHAPMALARDLDTPRGVVFDLDPGPPADIVQCCQVALVIRDVLAAVGLVGCAKTSGSAGLQVYVPLNVEAPTHRWCGEFALAVAQLVQRELPHGVVTSMAKSQRVGKVLIDWSQNSRHKTTIAPYSLRAKAEPFVSTPVEWGEVEAGARRETRLAFRAGDVIDRLESSGDVFRPVLELQQRLPAPGGT